MVSTIDTNTNTRDILTLFAEHHVLTPDSRCAFIGNNIKRSTVISNGGLDKNSKCETSVTDPMI